MTTTDPGTPPKPRFSCDGRNILGFKTPFPLIRTDLYGDPCMFGDTVAALLDIAFNLGAKLAEYDRDFTKPLGPSLQDRIETADARETRRAMDAILVDIEDLDDSAIMEAEQAAQVRRTTQATESRFLRGEGKQ